MPATARWQQTRRRRRTAATGSAIELRVTVTERLWPGPDTSRRQLRVGSGYSAAIRKDLAGRTSEEATLDVEPTEVIARTSTARTVRIMNTHNESTMTTDDEAACTIMRGSITLPHNLRGTEGDEDGPTTTRAQRAGRAYELCGRAMLYGRFPEGTRLWHGTISPGGQAALKHAWIEVPDGTVWEPLFAAEWPTHLFQIVFRPETTQGAASYSFAQMIEQFLHAQTYGPWHD